jgi:spoIIIJ-associated protein
MNETCNQAREFFQSVLDASGIDLRVQTQDAGEGCVLNFEGEDSNLLLSEGGELLEAIQHLANQIFGRALGEGERIVCDVDGFRATREAELRAMARLAAQRVRSTGTTFVFGPMNANERRIIHTVLAGENDLHTESVGEGAARRLKVTPK